MNTESSLESLPVPTVPRLPWRIRHPKLNYNLTVSAWMLLGVLPGFGMFYACGLLQQRHLMTALEMVIYLMAGCVAITFGLLLGAIVGLLTVIAEKLCLPEK
jgi:hypothetical protein